MISATPVVLCGGSGQRLWPLSHTGFHKPFLCLTGQESLFQQAALRVSGLAAADIQMAPTILVTGEDHRFLATEQMREVGVDWDCALLEPVGRNTAPALTLASLAAMQAGEDPVLVVVPADQHIENLKAFTSALQEAVRAAAAGALTVLGVMPVAAETGYGYIQVKPAADKAVAQAVIRFVEKPNATTAQTYIHEGGYYWNAGIFVLKASLWLEAVEQFRLDVFHATQAAWAQRSVDGKFVRPSKSAFSVVPSVSVDHAVIEHCPQSRFSIKMVVLNAGWSDLGVWDAVWHALPKDSEGNAHVGDVLTTQSCNTLVHASSRLVGLVGVQDLMVVETPDAVLVVDKAHCQDVKAIVAQLQINQREELALHSKVHRPWGWYNSVDEGPHFKVKRLHVKPGASLSLQKHHHRAEHWIVVKGIAEVTHGDKVMLLSENQSTYIALGEVHRLSNPGKTPLEIIEVQSGSYLGEDDIVRFEDTYGRAQP